MKPALLCAFLLLGTYRSPAAMALPSTADIATITNTNPIVVLTANVLALDNRVKQLEVQVSSNEKKFTAALNNEKTMALGALTAVLLIVAGVCLFLARRQTFSAPRAYDSEDFRNKQE